MTTLSNIERRLGIEINWHENIPLVAKPLYVDVSASILTLLHGKTAPLQSIIANIEPEQIHLSIKQS